MNPIVFTIIVVVAVVVFLLLLSFFLGGLYRKVGPNQALILYGLRGNNVFTNGGAFVMPLFQRAQDRPISSVR